MTTDQRQATTPRRSVDERGRAIPMTDEEILARNRAAIEAIEAIADITDATDTDAMWERFVRELDEDRPSERRRFRSCD